MPASRIARGNAVTNGISGVLLLVDKAGTTGRAAVGAELAADTNRDHLALSALILLELGAVGLAVRLARRLSTELLRPVSVLRDSANSLATGDMDHRIQVDRADELGELATSFNAMADAGGKQSAQPEPGGQDRLVDRTGKSIRAPRPAARTHWQGRIDVRESARCSSWTSTISRMSTTAWATPRGTRC